MNVLSLFDGMSGGQIALKELGIIPDVYYASEIDKYAIAQTKLNFPNTIHIGSVVDVDVTQLQPIDLLLGGSPCQSFSFAGKRKGMATKSDIEITKLEQYIKLKEQGFEFEGQSYLFWEYMRILTDIRQYNPNVLFLLENVEMGDKWERVLSEAIGIFGVHINSALVSAQNRKRIYWTNIKTRTEGLFGELYSDILQPEDRGILLRDILEKNVDEKYFLSDKMLKYFETRAANFNNILVNIRDKEEKGTTLCTSMASCDISDIFVIDTNGRIDDKKTGAILARYGKGPDNYSSNPFICVAMRGREACLTPKRTEYGKSIRKKYEAGIISEQRKNIQQLEPRTDGKTNTITSVQKDNLIFGCDYRSDEGIRIKKDGKSGTLCARARNDESCGQMVINQTQRIRRLTPTECSRLQTVPSWYIWECSETQQYKLLGNGWTIEAIKHILKYLI